MGPTMGAENGKRIEWQDADERDLDELLAHGECCTENRGEELDVALQE